MKRKLSLALALVMMFSLTACGDKTNTSSSTILSIEETPIVVPSTENTSTSSTEEKEPEEEPVNHDNDYRSELTNEWISKDIENQRPIAVMVDNETLALPHYGTSDADIVYEITNSLKNGRITRLMCIYKDWQNVERIGNVRSTRPTNCFIAPEYNAILVHDGGPYYINTWLATPGAKDHLSGGFARISREGDISSTYEEFVTNEDYKGVGEYAGKSYDGLLTRINAAKIDLEYNKYYKGPHFTFSDSELSLADESDVIDCKVIKLPHEHNETTLTYDEKTKTYVYSEYGKEYVDALYDDGRGMSFKNVIIQVVPHSKLDDNGYLIFNAIGKGNYGYYCTDGKAIPITWEKKPHETLTNNLTKFYKKSDGEEITLNTGKIYITIVPEDVRKDIVIE